MSEQIVERVAARPMRRAVRTAATVIIAVGATGVVAQLAPHYGPLYAYLAALVALTWLEGIVVALLAAAGVLAAYQLIIVPAPIDWRSWIIVGTLTALVVLATKIVRRPRRPRAPEPRLFETPAPEDLRAQLADALAAVYEANQLRASEAATAREREKRLCEQYEQENEHTLAELERLRQENEALKRSGVSG